MSREPNSHEADCTLIERVCGGDRAAWGELVARHAATVRFALLHALARYGEQPGTAQLEDLEADLWLRLVARDFARLRQYCGRSSLRQWLKVVAGNFAVDHLRRRRPTVPLAVPVVADDGEETRLELVCERPAPDELLDDCRRRRAVTRMLSELNDEDRLFVELYYVRGLGYEDVAELMGTTVAATYQRRTRLRKRLTALAEAAELVPRAARRGVR